MQRNKVIVLKLPIFIFTVCYYKYFNNNNTIS